MEFSFFMYVFFCFLNTLERFSFHSSILLTLWFRYLQTRIKESCLYLSSQHLFKTPHETVNIQEKCIFEQSPDLNFKNFSFGVYHGASQSHWTNQTLKELNLWGKTAVDKSAWIKAWKSHVVSCPSLNVMAKWENENRKIWNLHLNRYIRYLSMYLYIYLYLYIDIDII